MDIPKYHVKRDFAFKLCQATASWIKQYLWIESLDVRETKYNQGPEMVHQGIDLCGLKKSAYWNN